MNFESILELVTALLPAIEQGLSVFIHNKNSQQKFATVVGDANTVAAVASAIAQSNATAK